MNLSQITQKQKIIAGAVGFIFFVAAIVGIYFGFIKKDTPKPTSKPTSKPTPTIKPPSTTNSSVDATAKAKADADAKAKDLGPIIIKGAKGALTITDTNKLIKNDLDGKAPIGCWTVSQPDVPWETRVQFIDGVFENQKSVIESITLPAHIKAKAFTKGDFCGSGNFVADIPAGSNDYKFTPESNIYSFLFTYKDAPAVVPPITKNTDPVIIKGKNGNILRIMDKDALIKDSSINDKSRLNQTKLGCRVMNFEKQWLEVLKPDDPFSAVDTITLPTDIKCWTYMANSMFGGISNEACTPKTTVREMKYIPPGSIDFKVDSNVNAFLFAAA